MNRNGCRDRWQTILKNDLFVKEISNRTVKACNESDGRGAEKRWNWFGKHSTLISKAHFGEIPKPPEAENSMTDCRTNLKNQKWKGRTVSEPV